MVLERGPGRIPPGYPVLGSPIWLLQYYGVQNFRRNVGGHLVCLWVVWEKQGQVICWIVHRPMCCGPCSSPLSGSAVSSGVRESPSSSPGVSSEAPGSPPDLRPDVLAVSSGTVSRSLAVTPSTITISASSLSSVDISVTIELATLLTAAKCQLICCPHGCHTHILCFYTCPR